MLSDLSTESVSAIPMDITHECEDFKMVLIAFEIMQTIEV